MTFWYHLMWKWVKKSKDTYQKLESITWIYYTVLLLHFFYTAKRSFTKLYLQQVFSFNFPWHFPFDIFLESCAVSSYMVPETAYTYDAVFLFLFLHIVNYKSVKWEASSADWLRGQNLKTLWVQETSTLMKWKTDVRTL